MFSKFEHGRSEKLMLNFFQTKSDFPITYRASDSHNVNSVYVVGQSV